MIKCLQCNGLFPILVEVDGVIRNFGNRKYCLKCSPFKKHNTRQLHVVQKALTSPARNRVNLIGKTCLYCSKLLSWDKKTYCDNTCQMAFAFDSYIKRWKEGLEKGSDSYGNLGNTVRKYILKKYDNKCAKCGWCEINPATGRVPVTIDHIDGHWQNNSEENLILLCPNCHSLTPTYGGLNKGNGRGMFRYGPKFTNFLESYKQS